MRENSDVERIDQKRVLKWLASAAVFVIVFFGIALLLNRKSDKSNSRLELESALNHAKSVQLFTDRKSLQRAIPDKVNAFLAMHSALNFAVDNESIESYLDQNGSKSAAAKSIKEAKEPAKQISKAVRLRYWQVDRDYSGGFQAAEFPEFNLVKRWVKFFVGKARLDIRNGQYESGIDNFLTSVRIANKLQQEHFLIGVLSHCACLTVIRRGLASSVMESDGKAAVVAINEIIESAILKPNLAGGLKSETVFLLDSSLRINEWRNDPEIDQTEIANSDNRHPLDANKMAAFAIQAMIEAKSFLDRSPDDLPRVADDIENYLGRPMSEPSSEEKNARELLTTLGGVVRSVAQTQSQADLLSMGTKILEFRRKKKRLPKNLEEVGLSGKVDQWSGKIFGYQVAGHEFILRSVGSDRIWSEKPLTEGSDIVFQTVDKKRPVIFGK